MASGNLPLEGITVVALEQAVAAPFATRQLADLGARVIKVERPQVGDFARSYDGTVKGMASHFVWLNRSKESLTLDLKEDESKEALHRDRKSTRLNSSHANISYAVFCLKKKNNYHPASNPLLPPFLLSPPLLSPYFLFHPYRF